MSTTTIRLPEALKARLSRLAEREGTSAHGLILEAISEKADALEQRQSFYAEAEARYAKFLASGKAVAWDEMRAYVLARTAGIAAAADRDTGGRRRMTRVQVADEVRQDFDRIIDHLIGHDAAGPATRIDAILNAIDALVLNPLIGRPAHDTLRELVIGQGDHGYVALYRYSEALDLVMIVALRAQKEAGYRHP